MQKRVDRVASLLMKDISQAIREDIQNPEIGFVTLTRVEVSKDIKSARVFYSVLGTDEEKKRTDLAIRNSAKEIKRIVNDRMNMRYAVDLRFIREEGLEHAFKIEEILGKIQKEREAKGGIEPPIEEPKP
jgi:ribosome-binding factor A